jgi:hypothetical protein
VKGKGIRTIETIGDSPVNLKWIWTRTGHERMRHPGRCITDPDSASTMEDLDDRRKSWIRVRCEEKEREDG